MISPSVLLFLFFLILSAFFSSSETAFFVASPVKINSLRKKGSNAGRLIHEMKNKVDQLLATILVGNTLVNVAAASVATVIFVSLMPGREDQAVILATVTTSLLILIFAEITPKTYAAHNPLKLAILYARPIRFFMIFFFPLVWLFTFLTRIIFPVPETREKKETLNLEEIKVLLSSGVEGLSTLRKRIVAEALDIGSRPVREVMVPRTQVKAIDGKSTLPQIIDFIRGEGFSRYPVFKSRLDNIQGTLHAKDLLPYLIDNKEFDLNAVLRPPQFIPEFASLEKAFRKMQTSANHLIYVVDEFGMFEGIVTIEDIIEEIVGEIQDEYDGELEKLITEKAGNIYLVKGRAPIKELNQRIPINLPQGKDYTTLAGYFLFRFGKLPREGDAIDFEGFCIIVEKMVRRSISLLRIEKDGSTIKNSDENSRYQ
ncbi:MAG: hemolysin family protein [Acidobacteriota bacterium]